MSPKWNPEAFPMPTPICLWAEVDLPQFGVVAVGNPSRLKNPMRSAMLLDEIRFHISHPTLGSGGLSGRPGGLGLVVGALFKLGHHDLTNRFVPIGLLAELVNPMEEGRAVFSWRLPRPLYLPADNIVHATFMANSLESVGFMEPDPITVRVAYAGRSLHPDAPVPDKVMVPWATSFVGKGVASGTDGSEESTVTDLVNSHPYDLHLQRFTGRILATGELTPPVELTASATSVRAQYTELLTRVRMTNAAGHLTVRDPTPFGHLFQVLDRSWTVNSVIPPKSFYRASIEEMYSFAAEPEPSMIIRPMISMVGFREVELR